MHGIFIAAGARLPQGKRIDTVGSVDIYPLMIEILGLPLIEPIDGDRSRLSDLLDAR